MLLWCKLLADRLIVCGDVVCSGVVCVDEEVIDGCLWWKLCGDGGGGEERERGRGRESAMEAVCERGRERERITDSEGGMVMEGSCLC